MLTARPALLAPIAFALSLGALGGGACLGPSDGSRDYDWVESNLTAAQRRARATQIRDAATANGITQGWLLAGIADAETSMSQCWSELTWACQGPSSSDCGGGPVVAGAGDGPCSLRQGGLGMFQFDAGTYDDTLRREGTRILSVAGNVAAAVDFTTAMVVRSVYISGVDNRAQAIEWMNGVRVGNGRWDAWVKTVTHYYNGCTPSASCWSSRYARYRDFTSNVYSEFGESFWNVSERFGFAFVAQSFPLARDPFPLAAGATSSGYLELRNTGTETWRPGHTFLGTTGPRDRPSPIAGPDWVSPSRAATVDRVVAPGASGRFAFTVRAPSAAGSYPQFFNLVEEGVAWFSDDGGVPDDQLQVRVESTGPAPCPSGIGARWSCDGEGRVRCVAGEVTREPCPRGCVADGADGAALCDGDGDGYAADDCDDAHADVHPGAAELCGDGVDQDCDGADVACDLGEPPVGSERSDAGVSAQADAGALGSPRYARPDGASGCRASSDTSSFGLVLVALGLLLARRRRGAPASSRHMG